MVFDKVETGKEGRDSIIVLARDCTELVELQKDLCLTPSGFATYVDPITAEYEKNFRPHITVAYGMPEEDYKKSLTTVGQECVCEGVINEVVLSVVRDITPEEARNPANKTSYSLD